MREWPNRTVSKTVVSQGTVGSNPTPSARSGVVFRFGPAGSDRGPSPTSPSQACRRVGFCHGPDDAPACDSTSVLSAGAFCRDELGSLFLNCPHPGDQGTNAAVVADTTPVELGLSDGQPSCHGLAVHVRGPQPREAWRCGRIGVATAASTAARGSTR